MSLRVDRMQHPKHLDAISQALAGADLPPNFRRIRLELAREKSHPEGSPAIGYLFAAPLSADGRIDADLWHRYHGYCRVVRFRPDAPDKIGHLVRKPGGNWAFRYDVHGGEGEETGYHFGSEQFVPGEYVSIREADGLHAFRVVSVEPV